MPRILDARKNSSRVEVAVNHQEPKAHVESLAIRTDMTITVLDRTWEVEIWPASRKQVPNAVYLQVRHKPAHRGPNLLPGGLRFGLTESEVHRLAQALIEATTGDRDHATDILRSLRENKRAGRAPHSTLLPQSIASPSVQFTKTQGQYLLFIHRYISKFGNSPAESDIQRHFLVSAPSVNAMMQTLTRKGFISRVPGVPRSIRLLLAPELLVKHNES